MRVLNTQKQKHNSGSVTVEACFTIPLFLFFFMGIASIIMIFFAECHIHQSLADAGEVISKYYYQQQNLWDTEDFPSIYPTLLKKEFENTLGDDFYVSRIVDGGRDGIHLLYKTDDKNPKIFYINACYFVNFSVPVFGRFRIQRTVTVKQKGFVGYTRGEEEIDPYVYITPHQAVYHCSRNCTHLSLSVRALDSSNRSIYEPCRFCRYDNNESGTIYVARTSNLYHENRNCSGLKRTVTRVKKSSVLGLPPCERCGR